jgi:hypothetical protein
MFSMFFYPPKNMYVSRAPESTKWHVFMSLAKFYLAVCNFLKSEISLLQHSKIQESSVPE